LRSGVGSRQVYTNILYYLQNQESVSQYLQDWLEWSHQQRKLQAANPHPATERLRQLKAEQQKKTVAVAQGT
jgi:P pilus assembly chaperone PapD